MSYYTDKFGATGRVVTPPAPPQELPDAAGAMLMSMNLALQSAATFSPTERISIGLRLAVLAALEMPEAKTARGKVINAMCDDLRRNLQKFLPL